MSDLVTLRFETELKASAQQVWAWMTSMKSISREMSPYLRMTVPDGFDSLDGLGYQLGKPLFRSWLKLFGVLPIDYSDLTLIKVDPGVGFVEQSPMGSMRLWRHERRIELIVGKPNTVVLVDQLTFSPRFAKPLVARFVRAFFAHRHRVLGKNLGGTGGTCLDSARKC